MLLSINVIKQANPMNSEDLICLFEQRGIVQLISRQLFKEATFKHPLSLVLTV